MENNTNFISRSVEEAYGAIILTAKKAPREIAIELHKAGDFILSANAQALTYKQRAENANTQALQYKRQAEEAKQREENTVKALNAENEALSKEVERLKKELEEAKKAVSIQPVKKEAYDYETKLMEIWNGGQPSYCLEVKSKDGGKNCYPSPKGFRDAIKKRKLPMWVSQHKLDGKGQKMVLVFTRRDTEAYMNTAV